FLAVAGRGRLLVAGLVCGGGLADREPRHRLAAERILVEDGEAGKGDQEQAEHDREHLYGRERQPQPAFPARRVLSERGAQIIGRFSHARSRITHNDDTTPRSSGGRPGLPHQSSKQKGGSGSRPFSTNRLMRLVRRFRLVGSSLVAARYGRRGGAVLD